MYSIAMDVRKYRTYGIVERDGKITKEGYMPTTKEGFQSFLDGIDHATVIVEASSTILFISLIPSSIKFNKAYSLTGFPATGRSCFTSV